MIIQTYQQGGKQIRRDICAPHIFIGSIWPSLSVLSTNELITNCVKYAFPDKDQGVISITASVSSEEITIIVADDGVGIKEIPSEISGTLGFRLVNSLTRQLNGLRKIDREDGTRFPLIIQKPQNRPVRPLDSVIKKGPIFSFDPAPLLFWCILELLTIVSGSGRDPVSGFYMDNF